MDSEFMNAIAALCSERGVEVVRFEFPYMAQRRHGGAKRPPNKQDQLLECWDSIIEHYQDQPLPLFIGGKSMGGRMATLWAHTRRSEACQAVVCLGYPFHPAVNPNKLRIDHLPKLPIPALIVQGTRDPLGNQEQVSHYSLGSMVHLHWLACANHDLLPLKRSGISKQQALVEASDAMARFMLKRA